MKKEKIAKNAVQAPKIEVAEPKQADYRVLASSALSKFIIYKPEILPKFEFGSEETVRNYSGVGLGEKTIRKSVYRSSAFGNEDKRSSSFFSNAKSSSQSFFNLGVPKNKNEKPTKLETEVRFPSEKESNKFQKTITSTNWASSIQSRKEPTAALLPKLKETSRTTTRHRKVESVAQIAQATPDKLSTNFYSFSDLVSKDKSIHDQILNLENKAYDPSLFYKNQLLYNKLQQEMVTQAMENHKNQTSSCFLQAYQEKQKMSSYLERIIKKRPSKKQRNLREILTEKRSSIRLLVQNEKRREKTTLFPTKISTIFINDLIFTAWRPPARENATFVTWGFGRAPTGILYGGLSHTLLPGLWQYNFKKDEWRFSEIKGSLRYPGRFGHTMNEYKAKKCFVLFGGSLLQSIISKNMEALSDVAILSPENSFFQHLKTHGDWVEERHSHIAEIVHHYLIVHGGINSKRTYLSDTMCLDLESNKWSEVVVDKGRETSGIAHHRSCLVVKDDSVFARSIYTVDPNRKYEKNKYPIEGIYVFGGKNEECEVVGTLRVLSFGTQPLAWVYPETNGKHPSPRYLHSMTLVQKMSAIVIYGGQNDSGLPGFLSDLHILSLESLCWVTCQLFGDSLCRRSSHSVCASESNLFIFGGTNDKGYVETSIVFLELDQEMAQVLSVEHKMRSKLDEMAKEGSPAKRELENKSLRGIGMIAKRQKKELPKSLALLKAKLS